MLKKFVNVINKDCGELFLLQVNSFFSSLLPFKLPFLV